MNREDQIKDLNNRISELAIMVSVKTKEMDSIEKKYNERLEVLNSFIRQIQEKLNIDRATNTINDTDLIEKIKKYHTEDGDYLLIPCKEIIEETPSKIITTIPKVPETKLVNTGSRKKKMSCSYCNEKGHKRSQCPKILYPSL